MAAGQAASGLVQSTIYAMINQKRFPAPVKRTAHASAFRVREIRAWLANPTARRPDA